MPSFDITDPATDAIRRRCDDQVAKTMREENPIPLLLWSTRPYFHDRSGHRVETGPQFYFDWTNAFEVERHGYLKVGFGEGGEIAVAPGEMFRSGSHRIDLQDGRLILTR